MGSQALENTKNGHENNARIPTNKYKCKFIDEKNHPKFLLSVLRMLVASQAKVNNVQKQSMIKILSSCGRVVRRKVSRIFAELRLT